MKWESTEKGKAEGLTFTEFLLYVLDLNENFSISLNFIRKILI